MVKFQTTQSIGRLIFVFILKLLLTVFRVAVFVPGLFWIAGNEMRKAVYRKYP